MFYQIFRSPQVKPSVIIGNNHGIHDCGKSCPKTQDARSWELGKIRKSCKLATIITKCPVFLPK